MNIFFKALVIGTSVLGVNSVTAQASKTAAADTTARYYSRLATSTDPADKAFLETRLYTLLKTSNEKDWMMASRFFYQLQKQGISDSIFKAGKVKFPMGQWVRNEEVKIVYDTKGAAEKEAAYKAWMKKFPPEKMGTDRIVYDYARNNVGTAYAQEGNIQKALLYANMIETGPWKGEGYAGVAQVLLKNGHSAEAAELYKKAAANSYKYMTTNKKDEGAGFAAMGYTSYNTSLANILFEQKKYDEALKYMKEAHDSAKEVRANINSTYANILMALGKDNEAFEMINEAVKAGQANGAMKETLKTLYVKVKGSEAGYEDYMLSLNKILIEKIRRDVAKQMINKPAPLFTLKDMDGNSVSLQDMKGRTVVLDFWATWCGPCKRSFPAMRTAVNRYKDDLNVKFLFIHTWERDDTAITAARRYVTENKYPFEVLMDLKDVATGENAVVKSYGVNGIPAKFVIDKNGNIRFSFSGFAGGDDAAVEELAAMIELAQKS